MPYTGYNGHSGQYINRFNKIRVLRLLRESGASSRAEISRKTKLSEATISRIVDSLINSEGLVHDIGTGKSTGGRKPNLVQLRDNNNFVIGIDLGTAYITGVVANLNAEIISKIQIPTNLEKGYDFVLDQVCEVVNELISKDEFKGKRIFGAGIAVAGLVNRKKEIIEFSPSFGWHNVAIGQDMEKRCNIPFWFDNVVRVMALGELWLGIGKTCKNFAVVSVGYGIGAGIIIDGKPLYGPRGMAGEFGHMVIKEDSKAKCFCGNHGCISSLSSGRAIARIAKERITSKTDTLLWKMCDSNIENITTLDIAEAANNGDKFALEIFTQAAEYLGIGIGNLINLISPEVIIIGGGVAQSGDLLFDIVRKTAVERSVHNISRKVEILPATFGLNAAVMGAISMIINDVLSLNIKE